MHIQIASKHKLVNQGTTQLRCIQPAEYLRSCGFQVTMSQLYKSLPISADILILHRAVLDAFTLKYIQYAKARGVIVIYDTDDLIFSDDGVDYLKRIQRNGYQTTRAGSNPYRKAMALCDVVLVSVPYLADQAIKHHKDVRVIRNALSPAYLEVADAVYQYRLKKTKKEGVTIAYLSGSSSHDYDFKIIEPALLKLLSENPNIKFLLVGPLQYSSEFLKFPGQFAHQAFVSYHDFPKLFETIDINLIPLERDQPFCQGKSELKYIEAGICGVPSIASPTLVHQEVIKNGFNGMLAKEGDWYQAISNVIDNPELRVCMGENCRQEVVKRYGPTQRSMEWKELVDSIKQDYAPPHKKTLITAKTIMLRFFLERKRFIRISKAKIQSIIKG